MRRNCDGLMPGGLAFPADALPKSWQICHTSKPDPKNFALSKYATQSALIAPTNELRATALYLEMVKIVTHFDLTAFGPRVSGHKRSFEPGVDMSKIPQGEWDAIAARYAQGESISRIAQSYGCTPPAIHYILKRSRLRPAPSVEQSSKPGPQTSSASVQPVQSTPEPSLVRAAAPSVEDQPPERAASVKPATTPRQPLEPPARDREFASARPRPSERPEPAPPQPMPAGTSRGPRRASAFTAELDRELHGRAEAAIAAFRSSFDAALTEGSPLVRQRLRQAASDLMRVAARTTIVLDRLNASAERSAGQAEDHLRR
jgi:hypothetical protein